MQIKGEQLAGHLEREFRPLYVVWGDDPLLVIEASDLIRAAARRHGYSEREVLTALPGFDWGELNAAGGNLSLFGDRKLIDLRLPTGKPGRDGAGVLQSWCARLSPDVALLVTLPELDWKEEKSAWFTALVQAGVGVRLFAPPLAELPGWIAGRLRRQQQGAGEEALRFIAERVEGNLLAAHQEIQKLGLLYPAGQLSLEQVREAVLNVARYDLDGLREALLAGDIGRLTRTLDGLRQEGEPLPLVLWAVSEEIRTLALVSQAQARGQSLDAVLKDYRVWGVRQSLMKRALQRLPLANLESGLRQAAKIDRLIKGIGDGEPWNELLKLSMRLAAPTVPVARPG